MLRISDIRINHLKEPRGIWERISVSWKIQSDNREVYQTGYHMQIAKTADFDEIVFDTGIVNSGESVNVSLPEMEWVPACRYLLRVRIQDNHGESSEWQNTGFLTALHPEQGWRAKFITAELPKDKNSSAATIVRKEFNIQKPLKEAFLVSTAQGLYQTFLNGIRIGKDELAPGWTSYNKRLLYQTYEVTDRIVSGVNAWSALVGAGWYKGDVSYYRIHNFYGEYAAFSGELILRYEDGSEDVICTDESWKGKDSAILFSDIYDGEIYDGRLEMDGWKQAGCRDENWRRVRITEQKTGQLVPQSGSTVQIQETIDAKELLVTPKGEIVLDFGQNVSGWVHFKVKGNPGDIVELVCFETLDSSGNVYVENLRTAKQTIRYICKGGKTEMYHPHFTFQGFRYVWIKQYPGKIFPENFKALVLYSDMQEVGSFHCSEPLLNQFQSNIMWGLKGNSVDIPSDCPQRDERLGWTGDVQVFCNTACYLMDMYEFYRKWLCDVTAEQQENGAITNVVPDVLAANEPERFCGAAGWGDVAVVLPWVLYQETGDKTIIHEQYDSMKSWINFVLDHIEEGIYGSDLQFGDWLALDAEEGSYHGATPAELTSAAYFSYVSGLFSKMAKIIGEEGDAEKYQKIHEDTVRYFQKKYFLPDGRMSIQTQTAHVLALSFQLAPEHYKKQTIDGLIDLLTQKGMHLSTGFLGTPFIMHALSENDHLEEAYELLLKKDFPSWLYQVEQGATTVWEHWDGLKQDGSMWSADMNSFNHYAYGAIGKWLYEICAGLRRNEEHPGYKHFFVEPNPGGNLKYVKTTHLTEYGEICVGWERKEKQMVLGVQIPDNTTATIILNQNIKMMDSDGLKFIKKDNHYVADAGSGNYRICYQYIKL